MMQLEVVQVLVLATDEVANVVEHPWSQPATHITLDGRKYEVLERTANPVANKITIRVKPA